MSFLKLKKKKSFINFIYRAQCGEEERKGRALLAYVHQTVMLSVTVKCHYPILVSLLLPRYPYYIFKSFMQNMSNQLFNHLKGKVWSWLSADLKKNCISLFISGWNC